MRPDPFGDDDAAQQRHRRVGPAQSQQDGSQCEQHQLDGGDLGGPARSQTGRIRNCELCCQTRASDRGDQQGRTRSGAQQRASQRPRRRQRTGPEALVVAREATAGEAAECEREARQHQPALDARKPEIRRRERHRCDGITKHVRGRPGTCYRATKLSLA
jgi:hypothetical protein